jgi:tartrate dehydrogenase/decarboxylase / D-malate dehydrogenase
VPICHEWNTITHLNDYEGMGEPTATAAVLTAIETVLARGGDTLTPDMGGTASTEGLGKAAADAVTAS